MYYYRWNKPVPLFVLSLTYKCITTDGNKPVPLFIACGMHTAMVIVQIHQIYIGYFYCLFGTQ